ncbi:MAG: class I SAM-dependent methyltransferase [Candidatus Doudnabacteria bacterium]
MARIPSKPLYMKKADLYDRILSDFPYVEKTFDKILLALKDYIGSKGEVEILEFGFGTGLLTEKIAKLEKVSYLTGIDPSGDFYSCARKRLKRYKKVRLIKKDAISYKHPHPVDIIVTSFTYHHIPDAKKLTFLKSAVENLKAEGILILGDEFISSFRNKKEKIKSIKKFYSLFMFYLKTHGARKETLDAFQNSLKGSLQGVEEFKTSLKIFKKQLTLTGLKIIEMIPIYPRRKSEEMGCKVIILLKT